MITWAVEWRRIFPVYLFRLHRFVEEDVPCYSTIIRKATYWAWTLEGVRVKALRETERLDNDSNQTEELTNG